MPCELVPRPVRVNFNQIVPLAMHKRQIVPGALVGPDQGLQDMGIEADKENAVQPLAASPRRHDVEMVIVGLGMDDSFVTCLVRIVGKRGNI